MDESYEHELDKFREELKKKSIMIEELNKRTKLNEQQNDATKMRKIKIQRRKVKKSDVKEIKDSDAKNIWTKNRSLTLIFVWAAH